MLKAIRTQARVEHWRQGLLWIGFYAVGALMPVWLSALLLVLFTKPIGLGTFLDDGQFAIYAAAALSPVLYALYRQGSGQERTLYLLLTLFCLIVAAGLFSGLTVVDTLRIGDLQINVTVLRISSLTIYAIALAAMFLVEVHENVYNELDVPVERSARQDVLDQEFDQVLDSLESDEETNPN